MNRNFGAMKGRYKLFVPNFPEIRVIYVGDDFGAYLISSIFSVIRPAKRDIRKALEEFEAHFVLVSESPDSAVESGWPPLGTSDDEVTYNELARSCKKMGIPLLLWIKNQDAGIVSSKLVLEADLVLVGEDKFAPKSILSGSNWSVLRVDPVITSHALEISVGSKRPYGGVSFQGYALKGGAVSEGTCRKEVLEKEGWDYITCFDNPKALKRSFPADFTRLRVMYDSIFCGSRYSTVGIANGFAIPNRFEILNCVSLGIEPVILDGFGEHERVGTDPLPKTFKTFRPRVVNFDSSDAQEFNLQHFRLALSDLINNANLTEKMVELLLSEGVIDKDFLGKQLVALDLSPTQERAIDPADLHTIAHSCKVGQRVLVSDSGGEDNWLCSCREGIGKISRLSGEGLSIDTELELSIDISCGGLDDLPSLMRLLRFVPDFDPKMLCPSKALSTKMIGEEPCE